MIALSSTAQMVAALRGTRHVLFSAYALWPGTVERELVAAAKRGARVTVRLEGAPFDDASGSIRRANEAGVAALKAAGADAALDEKNAGPAMHMKAAVCDGVAFLDDRNWLGSGETVVRDDDRRHVRALRHAIETGEAHDARNFWTDKAGALSGEATLIAHAHTARLDVESETITVQSPVYAALRRRALSAKRCRLLLSRRERTPAVLHAAQLLAALGVSVRFTRSNEKFAVAPSERAWIGSANATSSYCDGDRIDWGMRTAARTIVSRMEHRFETNWRAGSALSAKSGKTE